MSLPVCPECGGNGQIKKVTSNWSNGINYHKAWTKVPCPACGGTGRDISRLTAAIAEALENHGLLGARIDAMASSVVLAVLAVLDEEGT